MCLDYTNNATQLGLGQTHLLMPSTNLVVIVSSLPTRGTLSYGNGILITSAPFVLPLAAANIVQYTPVAGESSWYADWTSASGYIISKQDYANFTYRVQDPDGAQSEVGTVIFEVYPVHTPPSSGNVAATQSTIYAGRAASIATLDNAIFLLAINNEYLRPSSDVLRCDGSDFLRLCNNYKDTPSAMATYVTIKSLPSKGTLKYKQNGMFYPISIGTYVPADGVSNCLNAALRCDFDPSWIVYYEIPSSNFNSSEEVLGSDNFTYSTTTTFDIQSSLGTTRYNMDSTGLPQLVGFSPSAESAIGTVDVSVKNGFFARSTVSSVQQKRLSSIQNISLYAQDVSVLNPNILFFISSLPNKGGLFALGSATSLTINDLPYPLLGSVIGYQHSLPGEPYAFTYGSNYASFDFYAISGAKTSNVARLVINVRNTNDAVNITWSPNTLPVTFLRTATTAQTWSDLPNNGLAISFTDPDVAEPNEPYYKISIDASGFSIFFPESIYNELQIGKEKNLGQQQGAGAPGAGSSSWEFIVPRDVAKRALLSTRVRPNNDQLGSITVKVLDCVLVEALTDSKFDSADWSGIEVSAVIIAKGVATSDAPTAPNGMPPGAPTPAGGSQISAATSFPYFLWLLLSAIAAFYFA